MAGNGCLSCALLCTASTLLPRMRGARWWTRQADPFTPAFTENSKFAALFGRPIQDSRIVGYEGWSRPQRVRNFLSVRYRQVLSRALSVRCERSKKDKVQLPSFRTSGGILAIQLPVQRCPSVNATSRNFLVCAILYQRLGLHVRLVHASQDHVLGTLTAQPEVFQPLATCLRRQNELIDLAITQVVEFPPAVGIGALANHRVLCSILATQVDSPPLREALC